MPSILADIDSIKPKDRKTKIVAIDGYGGSGKSTLGALLADTFNATVVHTDDFAYPLNPWMMNGWDYQRIIKKLIRPILNDVPGRYQKYQLGEWQNVPVGGTLIFEGVSSMRKELGLHWDYSIWVSCPYPLRLQRGVERDGEAKRSFWIDVWMPEEEQYFNQQRPDQQADIILDGSKPFNLATHD